MNFKKKVDLSDIIKSPFYHRYRFVRTNGIAATAAMLVHHSLPKKLVELELDDFGGEIHSLIKNLPNLRRLRVNKNCQIIAEPGCLPQTLKSCTWYCGSELKAGILPEGLIYLDIDYYGHQSISIPHSVEKLRIGIHTNEKSDCDKYLQIKTLPSKLKILVMEDLIQPDSYPSSLQKVIYGCKINFEFKSFHFNKAKYDSKIKVICMKEHPKSRFYGLI